MFIFSSKSFIITNQYNEYIKFYTQKDIYYKVIYNGLMNSSFTVYSIYFY